MTNITLREWEKRDLTGFQLTSNDRRFLNKLDKKGYLSLRLFRRRTEIETNRYVGLIQLENGSICIEPKIENYRLLWMMDYGSRLNFIHTFDIEALAKEGDFTLPDLIFIVFLRKIDRIIRQGLHKSYISLKEKRKHLEGKILLYDNLVRNQCPASGLWVEHDELTHDILENRIIASALRVVGRISRIDRVKRSVQRCLSGILPVVSDVPIRHYDCRRVSFNRLNSHYETAINLARLILEYSGIEEINQPAKAHICSFLVNMDFIFKDFLERLFREHLPGFDLTALPRHSQFIRERETGRSRNIRPDFIFRKRVCQGEPELMAADVKYKVSDKPSIADLYQIFFYSLAISGRSGLAYLIYPGSVEGEMTTVDLRGKEPSEITTTVKVIKIPLLRIINYLSSKRELEVKAILRKYFRQE